MSINTFTHKVEFRFTPGSGSWDDMSGYIDTESGLSFTRGIGTDRKMRASGISFSMDNSSEDLTIGNASSTYFNKLRKGIECRYSWSYSGTPKYEFRGYVTTIRPKFAGSARAKNRVEFQCEGQTAFLRAYTKYGMTLQASVDVDDALTAIMVAVGQDAALYSFDDSGLIIPYFFPRGDALTDLVAAAQSDPGMILFEDGQGRMRLKSIVGGNHASPTHTWGTTIYPETDVSPDYQNDSQVARASVDVGRFKPTVEDVVLYRHPLNTDSGLVESLSGYSKRRISGEFAVMPTEVTKKFSQTQSNYQATSDSLGAAIGPSDTTVYTSSPLVAPKTFRAGDEMLIDQEVMLVTATISTGAYYQQKLTVTRGQGGTQAVAHTPTPPAGTLLYRRGVELKTSVIGTGATSASSLGSSTLVVTLNGVAYGLLEVGDLIKIDNEIMEITDATSSWPQYGIARGKWDTQRVSHPSGRSVYLVTVESPVPLTVSKSYVLGSAYSSGLPATSPDIVGNPVFANADHIQVTGNKFVAEIYNNSSAARYLSDLVIGGKALSANGTTAKLTYEKAIPYVFGIPEASSVPVPYGFSSIYPAKAYAMGLLRAGRVPTPWLTLTFTANQSENTTSMQAAEVGDLVRYTGTGSYRERIDEWYRIVGVKGDLLSNQMLQLTFTLAPSHLWRQPQMAWYTDFNWGVAQGVLALGEFDVSPPGTWSNVGNWTRVLKSGRYEATFTVAAPSPAAVDVGSADQTVFAHIAFNSSPCTYPADAGGVGVMFRGNASTPSAFWEARFNPTTSQVILWNTSDGTSAAWKASWTPTATPEIEVRCQGDRIRVFVDCAAEPLLDITSTRFNTQRYAGPAAEVTSLAGSPVQPTFKDWGAHGL